MDGAVQEVMFEGLVEALTRHEVRGWAKQIADPERRLTVELVARGRVITNADTQPDGRFRIAIPPAHRLMFDESAVRIAGTTHLIDMPPTCAAIEGALDSGPEGLLSGWAWRIGLPRERITLFVFHKRKLLGKLAADRPRKGRTGADIGDGRHGFLLDLTTLLGPSVRLADITLRVQDGETLRLLPLADTSAQPAEPVEATPERRTAAAAPAAPAARPAMSNTDLLRQAVEESLDLGRLKL